MTKKLAFERFFWFHREVKEKRYPNASLLAKEFETSKKTAQRDIEFMTERLNAPLFYSSTKKGYYYSDDIYEVPALWLNKEEIIALLLAKRLASTIPDRNIKSTLDTFLKVIFNYISPNIDINVSDIEDKISIKNIEYYDIDDILFNKMVDALLKRHTLKITYYSPHKDEKSVRDILPLHLLHYMGNWHIIAYCCLRRMIRNFALSRIKKIDHINKEEAIEIPDNLPSIKEYIREHFGIFTGGDTMEVRLRFSKEVSRWVKEQLWHPKQKSVQDKKGRIILSFPVTDFREIKREILKFGADAEVLSPKELVGEVKKEVKKMEKVYM